jgi:hypothetical protein
LLPSPPTMLSLGSATAATGYTNYETAFRNSRLNRTEGLIFHFS